MHVVLDAKNGGGRLKLIEAGEWKKIPAAPVQTEREAAFPQLGPRKFENGGRKANRGPEPAKSVAESPVMDKQGARLHGIKVKLDGAKELYLVVDGNGEISFDWANWVEPRLHFTDGS